MNIKNTMLKNSSIEWIIEALTGYMNNEDNLPSFERLIKELEMIKNLK